VPLRRSSSTLIAAAVAVALTAVTAVTAAVTAAPSAGAHTAGRTAGRTYVALGDSYAAGFGLPAPATPTRPAYPGCAQTSLDYPHRLAAKLSLRLTDVSCSGASTADFSTVQDVPGPKPPAQLDVVKALHPSLVTVTIGGNDLDFTSIAQTCLAASPAGPLFLHPTFASCSAYFASPAGSADNPYARLEAVGAKVRAALMAVHRAAPHAAILVIAYPAIAPNARNTPAGGCFAANTVATTLLAGAPLTSAFPFTDADVPFLALLQRRLDAEIAEATRDSGGSYADIYTASLRHSACSPERTRWVEPVVPGGGGSNVLHPSLAGTAAMATTLAPTATRLLTHDQRN
jgi:lysophospholipase L1-like esterase